MTDHTSDSAQQEQPQEHHHHHHHHHHEHRKDDSDRFKEHQLNSIRRKKTLSRALYIAMCVLAALITLAVIWVYTNE